MHQESNVIGLKLPPPPMYSAIFLFELLITFFNCLQWNPSILSSTRTIFTFLKKTFQIHVGFVLCGYCNGRCAQGQVLSLLANWNRRREARGTKGLREKEEIKHWACETNPRGSLGLHASLVSTSAGAPSALSKSGRSEFPCRVFRKAKRFALAK